MRSFIENKNGNFGAILAIIAVPLIGAAGIAVDYARASNALAFAHAAGDAAILAGVQEAKRLYESGTPARQAETAGRAFAIEYFQTQVGLNDKGIFGWFTPAVRISNNEISGTLGVDVDIQTTLSRVLRRETLPIQTFSRAAISLSQYVDLHFVIDNSASMGVGADTAEITALTNATRGIGSITGCAFACHVPDELVSSVDPSLDTWDLTRAQNITLRLDVVTQAVNRILADLQARSTGGRIRVAIHTFSNTLTTLQSPNPSMQSARNQVASIELSDDLGAGGTDFHAVFDDLEATIGTSGDGSSPTSPRKAVVFISDGLSTNAAFAYGGVQGHSLANPSYTPFLPTIGAPGSFAQIQGFDERICDDLKTRNNVTVATLNVSYVIPTQGINFGDTRFRDIELILKDDIESHLEACATSPALFERADNSADVLAAITQLIGELETTTLRLTN